MRAESAAGEIGALGPVFMMEHRVAGMIIRCFSATSSQLLDKWLGQRILEQGQEPVRSELVIHRENLF